MNKEYQINSIQDIIDCTNANNIDNFLKDLKGFILGAHLLNAVSDSMELERLKSKGFTWIDDGKNEITFNLQSENEKSSDSSDTK